MKKAVIALFAPIYLLISSGMAFSVHYCMGERDAIHFGVHETDICGRCGMEELDKGGCCKDEHFFVKLDTDQQTALTGVSVPFPPQPALVPVSWFQPVHPQYEPGSNRVFFSDISPPPLLVSRNILFSNFRI